VSRITWAERKPTVQWGEERGSPVRTLIAFFVFFAMLGFGLRILWGIAG
jgi:hypothetical protein